MEDATGTSLSITNAREEDSGVYQCVATNPAGAVSSAVLVQISSESVLPYVHTGQWLMGIPEYDNSKNKLGSMMIGTPSVQPFL